MLTGFGRLMLVLSKNKFKKSHLEVEHGWEEKRANLILYLDHPQGFSVIMFRPSLNITLIYSLRVLLKDLSTKTLSDFSSLYIV